MRKWYESRLCSEGIVIAGQVCLVRNVDGYPFVEKMTEQQQSELKEKIVHAAERIEDEIGVRFTYYDLASEDECVAEAFKGRLAIPPFMYLDGTDSGLLISDDESVSILINGREHICIQISGPGKNIYDIVNTANIVDDLLNSSLVFAYSNKYGYLTANPQFTGTGISVSYLLHLPFLEKGQKIAAFEKELTRYGFYLGGHFDGRVKAPGGIYRVRNRKTLGLSEPEIISALEQLTVQMTNQEKAVAEEYMKKNYVMETDLMYRAYGLLRYARSLDFDETMSYLSLIRSGDMYAGWADDQKLFCFGMMVDIQDSVIELMSEEYEAEGGIKAKYFSRIRADYIHEKLGYMPAP